MSYLNCRILISLPIRRKRESLRRTKKWQAPIGLRHDSNQVDGTWKFRTCACYGLCQSQPGREEDNCEDDNEMRETSSRISTYFWIGTGNPWAGHNKVTDPPLIMRNPLMSSIVGNFGFTLPTGSKHYRTVHIHCICYYHRYRLCVEGTGNPCEARTKSIFQIFTRNVT